MSRKITVTLTEQVGDLLDQIAATGLMGRNPAEVAHRFIDQAVVDVLQRANLSAYLGLKMPRPKKAKKLRAK